jgi:hypothetical protein
MNPLRKDVMSKRYAIRITEDNLDLIQFLNDGVEVKIEDKPTYYLLDIESPTESGYSEIRFEDDLYDETGHAKDDITFIIG